MFHTMNNTQQRLFHNIGYNGSVIGRFDGVDESLEETLNLTVKKDYKGTPTAKLVPMQGNMAVQSERKKVTIEFHQTKTLRISFQWIKRKVALKRRSKQYGHSYRNDAAITCGQQH